MWMWMLEGAQGEGGTDAFGRLLKEQQKLLGEHDILIHNSKSSPALTTS